MKQFIIDCINGFADGLIWCVEMVDKFLLFCKSVQIEFSLYHVLMALIMAGILFVVGRKLIKVIKVIISRVNLKARRNTASKLLNVNKVYSPSEAKKERRKLERGLIPVLEKVNEKLASETPEERAERRKIPEKERWAKYSEKRSSA